MADATFWWLAAGGLIAAELMTGTFYLLMISAGLVAAALAAHAGMALTWQWVTAALVGGGSVLIWYQYKKSQPPVAPAGANHDATMDIGSIVHVEHWHDDGTCQVKYRGAQWEASASAGDATSPGSYTIVEVIGSRLILRKASI
ncbi:NfeD family protein [Rhodoferax sp.]|uniref:NfeD family protein n=1 Tax=Rhodoferax sp. TaxID=50421 RepID=UPI00260B1402|nr:NfeD family protein [Rhodoferax sp.]MDD2923647.1 NfeD family protein [Rhodoferax sp.]